MRERLKTLKLYLIAYPVEWFSALLLVVAVGGLLSVAKNKGDAAPEVREYVAGQCFVMDGDREIWDDPADGIIIAVGKKHYLYESYIVAARNAGKKPWRRKEWGRNIEFKELEDRSHQVTCPKEVLG